MVLFKVIEFMSGLEFYFVWFYSLCFCCFFVIEKRDEVVYYDTYESMEVMLEKEETVTFVYL